MQHPFSGLGVGAHHPGRVDISTYIRTVGQLNYKGRRIRGDKKKPSPEIGCLDEVQVLANPVYEEANCGHTSIHTRSIAGGSIGYYYRQIASSSPAKGITQCLRSS